MKELVKRKCKFLGEPTPRLNRANQLYLYTNRRRKIRNKDEYGRSFTIYFIETPGEICCHTGSEFFDNNFVDIQRERKLKLEKLEKL
jgi:hypothetical protein